ncbi:MPT63 family protein, partial [Mycolicibacterium insubricum]|nr:MPT63 family protein [Mycolicibacterium insubricum]
MKFARLGSRQIARAVSSVSRKDATVRKVSVAGVGAAAVFAAFTLGIPTAPADDPGVVSLGDRGELTNGDLVQAWTVTALKPSHDAISYEPKGTLWEATATDEAIQGSVIPMVSNFNARAANGDSYRVLFGIATPNGINPETLAPGEKVTGKLYFDVTGADP